MEPATETNQAQTQLQVDKSGKIHPDQSAAALSHSSMLLRKMLGITTPDQTGMDAAQPEVGGQPEETPTDIQQEPQGEPQEEPKVDNSEIEGKLKQLETTHQSEIAMLRAEISQGKMKEEHEAKIKALEDKHVKEMGDIKAQMESIINGNA